MSVPTTPLDLYTKIKSRLADSRFTFYDGAVPATPASAYVVGYPSPGAARRDRLTQRHTRLQFDVWLVCVGRSTSQCVNTVQIVRDLLTDWRPDLLLPASALAEQDNDAAVIRDESDLSDIRYSFTLQYRMHTARSPLL